MAVLSSFFQMFIVLGIYNFGLGQKSLQNFCCFLVDLKTPKGHFEINWPLAARLVGLPHRRRSVFFSSLLVNSYSSTELLRRRAIARVVYHNNSQKNGNWHKNCRCQHQQEDDDVEDMEDKGKMDLSIWSIQWFSFGIWISFCQGAKMPEPGVPGGPPPNIWQIS
jgi:hypothetical protein